MQALEAVFLEPEHALGTFKPGPKKTGARRSIRHHLQRPPATTCIGARNDRLHPRFNCLLLVLPFHAVLSL